MRLGGNRIRSVEPKAGDSGRCAGVVPKKSSSKRGMGYKCREKVKQNDVNPLATGVLHINHHDVHVTETVSATLLSCLYSNYITLVICNHMGSSIPAC